MFECVIPDMVLAPAELAYEIGNPTALLLAAQAGFPDCLQVLLQNGADLLMTDDFGSSVLRKAAGSLTSNDHTQLAILNLILNHSDAGKLLALDSKEHQAISQAAARGYTACVKRLLEVYRPENRQKSATSALFGAAEGGHALATEALIVAGATSLANLETGTPSALEVSMFPYCYDRTATLVILCCGGNQQGSSLTSTASRGHVCWYRHIQRCFVHMDEIVQQHVAPSCWNWAKLAQSPHSTVGFQMLTCVPVGKTASQCWMPSSGPLMQQCFAPCLDALWQAHGLQCPHVRNRKPQEQDYSTHAVTY